MHTSLAKVLFSASRSGLVGAVDVFEGTGSMEFEIERFEQAAFNMSYFTAKGPLKATQKKAIQALRCIPHGFLLLYGAE